jgi:hypothetical protein
LFRLGRFVVPGHEGPVFHDNQHTVASLSASPKICVNPGLTEASRRLIEPS